MSKTSGKKPLKRPKRRHYNLQKIKSAHCYDIAEIAALFGIHRNTVRHWLKESLSPIDDSRPILIHGAALKSFLQQKQSAKRQVCALDEFFCFRCRVPRKPWDGLVDFAPRTAKIAYATAICGHCETKLHRAVRCSDVPKIQNLLRALQLPPERLNDCSPASENSDFEEA